MCFGGGGSSAQPVDHGSKPTPAPYNIVVAEEADQFPGAAQAVQKPEFSKQTTASTTGLAIPT